MQSSQGQLHNPIPLIQFQGEKFRVTEEATQFLKKMQGPLGVITIVGKYRTGKSLFLNKVLLNNNNSFKVCPTINSCTKGLWISRQVIKSEHPDAQDMDVIVIDTQGFGAMQETDAYNNRILLFALLLSSYFIYNSVGSIDEKSLNNLNIITNLAKELQTKNMGNQKIDEEFPAFMWVVRDFTLRLVDNNGCQMQPKQYLEFALQIQKGISDAVQNKNKIRRMIKHFFKERDCFTLVTPVQNESQLQKLNSLPDTSLRPQFLEQIQLLRQKILKRVKPKKLKSRRLTGQTFLELASSYTQAINNGSLPNIESAWKSINNFQINQTLNKAKQSVQRKSKEFIYSIQTQSEFERFQKQLILQTTTFMKKKISNETDFDSNCSIIKQYISQNIVNCKIQNKKRSLQVLLSHFQENYDDFSYEQSVDLIENKWRTLQNSYKADFQSNPSLDQFFLKHLYPAKVESYTCLMRRQAQSMKSEKNEKNFIKETLEKQMRQQEKLRRDFQNALYESQKVSSSLKAKLEQESKIKQLEISFIQKELSQSKDELAREQNKNEVLCSQLKQKQIQMTELKIKMNSLSMGLKEVDDDRGYAKKQVDILKSNMNLRLKQIQQLKSIINDLKYEIQRLTEREKSMNIFSKNQINNKSQEYNTLMNKYEDLQKDNLLLSQKAAKLEYALESQAMRNSKQEKLYESMLQNLKTNYENDKKHFADLSEANKNMAFALKHLQQRFEQAEQKEKRLKEFKRCFKNSSCMQCQSCSKFFVPAIFPQHLNICILSPQSLRRAENDKKNSAPQIQIFVKQTLLKDSDSKPYTQYVLQIKKGNKAWTVNRKYKELCTFHAQLKTIFPGVNFSDFSYIVSPQQNGQKKPLLVEQRRKILERYLKDLCGNPHITQQNIWKQLIEDQEADVIMPTFHSAQDSKLALSELMKSSNKMINESSPQKENCFDSNKLNHKTPQQFLRIWNQRNLRAKQVSKNKKIKN